MTKRKHDDLDLFDDELEKFTKEIEEAEKELQCATNQNHMDGVISTTNTPLSLNQFQYNSQQQQKGEQRNNVSVMNKNYTLPPPPPPPPLAAQWQAQNTTAGKPFPRNLPPPPPPPVSLPYPPSTTKQRILPPPPPPLVQVAQAATSASTTLKDLNLEKGTPAKPPSEKDGQSQVTTPSPNKKQRKSISAAPTYNPKAGEDDLQPDALTSLYYNPSFNPDFHIAKQQQELLANSHKYSSEQTYSYVNNTTVVDQVIDKKKKKKITRQAAGEVWEDPTLADWPDNDYRIFVGDLGNDVTDQLLIETFQHYKSFNRAKVVRDKRTQKTKGFGFVSLSDPEDFIHAMTNINGKYIGNRPCKLRRSDWTSRSLDGITGAGPTSAGGSNVKKKHHPSVSAVALQSLQF